MTLDPVEEQDLFSFEPDRDGLDVFTLRRHEVTRLALHDGCNLVRSAPAKGDPDLEDVVHQNDPALANPDRNRFHSAPHNLKILFAPLSHWTVISDPFGVVGRPVAVSMKAMRSFVASVAGVLL